MSWFYANLLFLKRVLLCLPEGAELFISPVFKALLCYGVFIIINLE